MLAFLLAPFYLLFNLYLFRRIMGWVRAWFPWFRKRKHWAVSAALYAFFALSFVLAFPLPAGRLKRALMLIGNYWLGVLLYLLLAVLLADGLRLLLVHGLKLRSLRSARMHRIAGCLCAAAILVTSVGGVINARIVRVTPYEITVNKSAGSMESMKVVLLADLHLGYNVGLAQMERMVARVNEQGADAVVIAGDIFDNAWEAVEEPEQIAAVLRGIRSRYGVYAVYGNHDIEEPILAGFTFRSDGKKQSSPEMDAFLASANIRLLRDEGLKWNPTEANIYRELAFMFELKVGTDKFDPDARLYQEEWRRIVEDVQARGAWDEIGMDPAKMAEVEAAYDISDWTNAEASAIYWAHLGIPHASGHMKLLLQETIRQARILYDDPNRKDAPAE